MSLDTYLSIRTRSSQIQRREDNRRKSDASFLSVACLGIQLLHKLDRGRKRRRKPPRILEDRVGTWNEYVTNVDPEEFQERHRVTKCLFKKICRDLEPLQPRNMSCMRKDKHVRDISVCLRFLAGSRVVDLVDLYGVSKSEVYTVILNVCEMISKRYKIPPFPFDDLDKLREIERGFAL